MQRPRLSIIVICYNMSRELPRTIRSLSTAMQRNIREQDYEIIIIDNGSTQPVNPDSCLCWGNNIRIHHMTAPTVSPAAAINFGIELALGDLVGVWIDGARLASPGLLSMALNAYKLDERAVIGAFGFHLGPDLQARSSQSGYNQAREDELLDSVDWTQNGYALFDIAVFAASSEDGWFGNVHESNGLFLSKTHWQVLGGFETGFLQAGGGLVNLDMWVRAIASSKGRVILLLGEGTFHQIHGGIAANATLSPWKQFHDEYVALRGQPFAAPEINPIYLGQIHYPVLKSIAWSADRMMNKKKKPVAGKLLNQLSAILGRLRSVKR